MKNKKIFILLFVIVLMGLSTEYIFPDISSDPSSNVSLGIRKCYSALSKSAKKIERNYNLKFAGMGSNGTGEKGIYLLNISFYITKNEFSIEEARKLVIQVTNDLLKDINFETELEPFLKDFPITPKNVDIQIYDLNLNDFHTKASYLEVVNNYEGTIEYCTKIPRELRFDTVKYETFEEALAIEPQLN